MNRIILVFATVLLLCGCEQTEDEKASSLLSEIETLYSKGMYQQALDSITSLRTQFPKAIESRKQALKIWQDASLKIAQENVMKTDSMLQAAIAEKDSTTSRLRRNLLGVKIDSLKARMDAMSGVVRMVRKKQTDN
jgi:ABC-type uncharacterized transport system auxiliary subunit